MVGDGVSLSWRDCVPMRWTSNMSGPIVDYFCPTCGERAGWVQHECFIKHEAQCPHYSKQWWSEECKIGDISTIPAPEEP